jgi:hypothetical protein
VIQNIQEQFGEQTATVLQDLNEWAVLNPDKPFSEYLAERPNAALQTAIATLVGTTGQVAAIKAIEASGNFLSSEEEKIKLQDEKARKTLEAFIKLNILANESELKKRLLESVESMGEVDGKGHVILEVDGTKLTKQRKVSNPLNMDVAEQIIKEKGLEDTCIKMVPQIDSEAIMAAFYKKELTEEEIESMFPEKVSYAFLVS